MPECADHPLPGERAGVRASHPKRDLAGSGAGGTGLAAAHFLREEDKGVLLALKVQPRGRQNEICGVVGAELKVRVTAPPVDNQANEMLTSFVAGLVGCPRSQVSVVRGHTSQHKLVRFAGVPAERVLKGLSL